MYCDKRRIATQRTEQINSERAWDEGATAEAAAPVASVNRPRLPAHRVLVHGRLATSELVWSIVHSAHGLHFTPQLLVVVVVVVLFGRVRAVLVVGWLSDARALPVVAWADRSAADGCDARRGGWRVVL